MFFSVISFFNLGLNAGSFTTPPTQITPSYTDGVNWQVASCVINSPNQNQIVFSWSSAGYAKYIIYDVNASIFTTPHPIQINGANTVQSSCVFCCYNSTNNQVVFSWKDIDNFPYYIIYDVNSGAFTTLDAIKINPTDGYSAGVWSDVFCCYNNVDNQIVFSWDDYVSDNGNPWYIIYDVNSGVFTTSQAIQINNTTGVWSDVFCCYNSTDKEVVFSWAGFPSHAPYYSINGGDSVLVDNAYTAGVGLDVFCCYNRTSNEVVFSWADNVLNNPWYAIYPSTNGALQIDPIGYTQMVDVETDIPQIPSGNIFCCYNSSFNEVIFSWAAAPYPSWPPYYAIYNASKGIFTTNPTLLSQSYAEDVSGLGVFCSYNKASNEVVFSWASHAVFPSVFNPWYAIYTDSTNYIRLLRAAKYVPLKSQKGP